MSGGMAGSGLSVIIPTLNEAAGIEAMLRGLRAIAPAAEIILADGGSQDGTPALAAPFCDAVVAGPPGRARQMNAGAGRATRETLLFLHADTRLPPDFASQIAAALGKGARWGRFDVRIEGRSRWLPLVGAMMNVRSRLTGIATGDMAMFMSRAAFTDAGGFPDQRLMEDIEMSRRLKRLGPPACLIGPAITSGRRWDEKGALRTILLMWRLRLSYWLGADPETLAARYDYGSSGMRATGPSRHG
jgi:rSAM/selenodomain-associated transferase 2